MRFTIVVLLLLTFLSGFSEAAQLRFQCNLIESKGSSSIPDDPGPLIIISQRSLKFLGLEFVSVRSSYPGLLEYNNGYGFKIQIPKTVLSKRKGNIKVIEYGADLREGTNALSQFIVKGEKLFAISLISSKSLKQNECKNFYK